MSKKRVLLGLSGGVDSAVAAHLLLSEGYEVIGAFMKCWSGDHGFDPCWIDDRRDALRVGAQLGIPVETFDYEDAYREHVTEYMYREYAAGRTPNPDVLCNSMVKFEFLSRDAQQMGCDFIATGHYARTRKNKDGTVSLLKGIDVKKDQSYFLHRLTQKQLSNVLFPIGVMKKDEVRAVAREHDLCVADKRSTRGICFVGNVALKTFLKERLPIVKGNIVDVEGNVLGEHDGVQFFTIGQRKGFGVGGGKPYYVVDKNAETNVVTVAAGSDHPALFTKLASLIDVHWINTPDLSCDLRGLVRYLHDGESVVLNDACNVVSFDQPVKSVPPGQFLVVYQGDECMGGGIIDSVSNSIDLPEK